MLAWPPLPGPVLSLQWNRLPHLSLWEIHTKLQERAVVSVSHVEFQALVLNRSASGGS